MKAPVLNQCCCGCSLETGTKIIGWLYIVGSVFMVIGSLILLISPDKEGYKQSSGTVSEIFNIIFGLILFIATVLLLIGVSRRLPKYVHYWIVCIIIFVVASFLNGFIMSIKHFIAGTVGAGVSVLITLLISTALTVYFILVVFNFKRGLMSDNQQV